MISCEAALSNPEVGSSAVSRIRRRGSEEDNFGQGNRLTRCGNSPFLATADSSLQWSPNFGILDTQKSEIPQHIFRAHPTFCRANVPGKCQFCRKIEGFANCKRTDKMVFLLDVGAHCSQSCVIERGAGKELSSRNQARFQPTGNDVQQRRLPTARRTHESEEGAS